MDGIYRNNVDTPATEETLPQPKNASQLGATVEVPYTSYSTEKNHPFTVDYFELGDTWNRPEGGFPNEISLLEDYLSEQISSGEIANSVSSVKERLKQMEKVNNLNKEERTLVKVETLAAYVKFLMEKDNIKKQIRHYGSKY